MKERIKVQIKEGRAWYEGCEGDTFEVVNWGGHYVIADDYENGEFATWFHIDLADAEPVG